MEVRWARVGSCFNPQFSVRRDRPLKGVLVLVGLLFVAAVYPMVGGVVHPDQSDTGNTMMASLYAALGVFLLLAVRNPPAHRDLIAFTAWSSFAHAVVMSLLAIPIATERTAFSSVRLYWLSSV